MKHIPKKIKQEKNTNTLSAKAVSSHHDEEAELVRLDALFSNLRDAEFPVPGREEFRALLSRIPTKNIISPYAPLISSFVTLRFITPLALALLIVISGIGIETGRITIEGSTSSRNLSKGAAGGTAPMTMSYSDIELATENTAPTTFSEVTTAPAEEDYDAYFSSEEDAFTSIADAYDITL